MSLAQSAAPATYPITRSEAKTHLRLTADFTDDDDYVDGLIDIATQWVENKSNRVLVTQTWVWRLDEFPNEFDPVPKAPLQSVSSITYLDTAGSSQTLSTDVYAVDANREPGRIVLKESQTWPSTQSDTIDTVTVTFVAGYGAAAAVPERYKHAMKLLIGHWYWNREEVSDVRMMPVPKAANDLLWVSKLVHF